MWTVLFSADVESWLAGLCDDDWDSIMASIELLEVRGPALGRPAADRIKTSTHHNMKELRSIGGHLRVLFAFDPVRQAILLIGGDKSGDWTAWYERNIPLADALYAHYLTYLDESE